MGDVLIYGDTMRSAELRHELPLMVPDAFLYAEAGGERHVVVSSLEQSRIAAVASDVTMHGLEEFGYDDLVSAGAPRADALLEVAARACQALAVGSAAVPHEFPVALADLVRARGLELVPERALFDARRRIKSGAELAGIRRAQAAAQAGMAAAAELLRSAEQRDGSLVLGGEPLTCERIKAAIRDAVDRADATVGDGFIVSHGAQTAVGHELGSGPIEAGEPIVIDLWPRDLESSCFADMTRTFVVGDAPAELLRYHELTLESLERVRRAVRAGAAGRDVHGAACEPYEAAGLPTQRTKEPGAVLEEGFFHSLGHGVGLEVHEAPLLGRAPDVLQAGDVLAVEPGCYRPGFGGCRLEDLVYVTEDGAEVLTDFPYDLRP